LTRLALPARSPAGDFGDVALSDADLAWAEGISGHRLRGRLRAAARVLLTPGVAIPGVVFAAIVLACFAGPQVFGLPSPNAGTLTDTMKPLGTPGHLLGTNALGNDELSRLLYGGRVSLIVGVGATAISLTVGSLLGMSACYLGGFYEKVIMRLFDTLLAFPSLILALAIADYLGPSLRNTVIAISLFGISQFGRLAWSQTLRIRNRDFVAAPRADGAKGRRIILGHILPNVMPPLLGLALFSVGTAMMLEAGLSYLGLGIAQPNPSWGNMIADGQQYLYQAPRLVIAPCVALVLTVVSLNLMADAVQRRQGTR
jgi:ABC-type dipeptide/oligopeptide/nickel transport system permease subunit